MARYLVTGGCGFIGSHLVEALLAARHQVRILDDLSSGKRENQRQGSELLIGDVTDAAAVDSAMRGIDGCFHLAAIASVERSTRDWLGVHRTNLGGAINVFDSVRRRDGDRRIPIVYASSAAVYGDNPQVPLVETAPLQPLSPYGADKAGCELHARVAMVVHGIPTAGLRVFNAYGPRQDPHSPYSGVISIFARCLLAGQPLVIHGDGGQVRDFVYVTDVVRVFVAAMASLDTATPTAEIYNVASGRATSIKQLAELLAIERGAAPRLEFAPARQGDIRMSLGSGEKTEAKLGVRVEVALPEGLRRTLACA